MKKWILVLSLFGCSTLFFVSGSFLGYLSYEQKAKETPQKKTKRRPSKKLAPMPIFGRVVERQKVEIIEKVRIPTPNAVLQAQRYKAEYLDQR